MKKFLSLVLALVMTMSLVTISAGAKDFTDADSIDYTAAIEVMKACKVIDGYTDGSFRPDAALNRGQAAKIICNLILGPTTAAALPTNTAPFSDVAAGSTFAGYIAYCAKEGIINGYADGTFKPSNPLTGYAFMKMLLGALGYDPAVEGYNGANWAVSVAKQALALNLNKGLVDDFNGSKTVTRQEACLYALNTLNAQMVKYANKNTITIGDVVISQDSAAEAIWDNAPTNTDAHLFREEYFKKLSVTDTHDAFGRPATDYDYDGKDVAMDVEKADVTYTTGNVKQKTIYADLGLSKTINFYYNINGAFTIDAAYVVPVAKADSYTTLNGVLGNGVKTEVFYDWANGVTADDDFNVVVTYLFMDQVAFVDKDADGNRIIRLKNTTKTFKTEEFAKDDWVLLTVDASEADATKAIKSVELATKMTGKLEKIVSGTYYIAGVPYKAAAAFDNVIDNLDTTNTISGTVGKDVTFYLDSMGYIRKMGDTSATASLDNLAYNNTGAPERTKAYAELYKTTGGKSVEVSVDAGNYYTNKIVKFSVENDVYELSEVGVSANGAYYFVNGAGAITLGGSQVIKVDSTTTFMYIKDGKATMYTGKDAAPSVTPAATAIDVAAYCTNNDMTKVAVLVVFELAADTSTAGTSTQLTFVAGRPSDKISFTELEESEKFYTFASLSAGALKDINMTQAAGNYVITNATTYVNDITVLKTLNFDNDGYVTNVTTDAAAASYVGEASKDYFVASTNVSAVSNGVITLDSNRYAVADDAAVYHVDKYGAFTVGGLGTIVAVDKTDAASDAYAKVYVTWDKNGVIDTVITIANPAL